MTKSAQRGRDTDAARRVSAGALLVPISALILVGCGDDSGARTAPAVPPTPPTTAPLVTADFGACDPKSLIYISCTNRASKSAQEQNKAADDAYREAKAQYDSDWRAWNQAQNGASAGGEAPTSKKAKHEKRARWIMGGIAAALAVFALAAFASSPDEKLAKLPPHRDRSGPAAGAIRADAAQTRAGGWGLIAIAAFIACGVFGSGIGGWLLGALVGAVPMLISVNRHSHWGCVEAGYKIADGRWITAADAASRAGRAVPAEPHMDDAAAHRLGLSKGFETPEGSAASVMLGIDGSAKPTVESWHRVARALDLGTTDEAGRFTPRMAVETVSAMANGDVQVAWRADDLRTTPDNLRAVVAPLLRDLKVRALVGGAFTVRHTDGRIIGVFTNTPDGAAPAAQPQAPKPKWDF